MVRYSTATGVPSGVKLTVARGVLRAQLSSKVNEVGWTAIWRYHQAPALPSDLFMVGTDNLVEDKLSELFNIN